MAALITFKQAKRHVRAPFEEDGNDLDGVAELRLMMEQATALCLAYTERAVDDQSPAWTSATDPATDADFAMLQAGILRMLMHLWRWRGDDEKPPAWSPHDLPADVVMILRILKEYPTIA